MTLEEVIAQLHRGLCHPARAAAAGCHLCEPQYAAIAQITEWHRERSLASARVTLCTSTLVRVRLSDGRAAVITALPSERRPTHARVASQDGQLWDWPLAEMTLAPWSEDWP